MRMVSMLLPRARLFPLDRLGQPMTETGFHHLHDRLDMLAGEVLGLRGILGEDGLRDLVVDPERPLPVLAVSEDRPDSAPLDADERAGLQVEHLVAARPGYDGVELLGRRRPDLRAGIYCL